MFCEYSEIFGKPGEGIHSIRIFDIAIIDVVLTIIGAYYFHHYIVLKYYKLPLICTIGVVFILGIIFHKLFCVNTGLNKSPA